MLVDLLSLGGVVRRLVRSIFLSGRVVCLSAVLAGGGIIHGRYSGAFLTTWVSGFYAETFVWL